MLIPIVEVLLIAWENLSATFRSSTVMKVVSNSLGLNLGALLSVPPLYESSAN